MNNEQVIVANLKCNGCANSIKKELSKIVGLSDIMIEVEESTIHYTHTTRSECTRHNGLSRNK